MMIALTGTPGTGKTRLAVELMLRGYKVLDINEYATKRGLLGERDEERDTHSIDVDALDECLNEYRMDDLVFIEGHLSHCVECDVVIVLRCHPDVIAKRLRERGYKESKVLENVQAEVLDVILCESTEADATVWELDLTDDQVFETADKIEDIIKGNTDKYRPGNINWSSEMEKWF
jgi:adenylate kinase